MTTSHILPGTVVATEEKCMEKKHQLNLVYLFVALWGIVLFQSFWGHTASQVELNYSEFERYLEQG